MEETAHLRLARANQTFANELFAANGESSWRWTIIVAFYAANHFAHALFARETSRLPADYTIRRRNGDVRVSYRHPNNHGRFPGGTRASLQILAGLLDLSDMPDVYADMFEDSRTARYGRDGVTYTTSDRLQAAEAIARLDRVVSIIEPYLR